MYCPLVKSHALVSFSDQMHQFVGLRMRQWVCMCT